MQICQFISLSLPRIFIKSDVFIKKNLNFACSKFRGPVLLQFNLCECECVCVCVCVSVCGRVCLCMYKCDKWKQCFNCHMNNTIDVFIFEMWQNFKSSLSANLRNLSLINITQTFTCLKLCYISSSIKILYTLK